MHEALVVTQPGLEAITATELVALGLKPGRIIRGGLPCRATTAQLYAMNLRLRTATRVQVRVASFDAPGFRELQNGLARIEWDRYLRADALVDITASTSLSKLYHSGAVIERVREALDRGEGTDQRVLVRIDRDRATVSIDSSGDRLHRRGWRLASAKAPMRESLAAALLLVSGWSGEALVDPFCGSGTIAVEAALLARNIAPGRGRPFAFQRWPSFKRSVWRSVSEAADAAVIDGVAAPIRASDRDAGAVRATGENAERAGVAEDIVISRADVDELRLDGEGFVVTNPPYGRRISGDDLPGIYGALSRRVPAAWCLALVTADPTAASSVSRLMTEVGNTTTGGIAVRMLRG